ncbi:hypothetical protein NG895_27390 [Aeoliella sp. ICT_H6.2]|uniref:Uncharacterized protein n=1 Tax=Aeoliella straminimaris TaxID=2954799 RepID=A0A9X2FIZ0_9BACT|nr:hypothetical protein [Aeoliella straminimaris]MCO6047646.1 hypothetical protein [Aeoliella straminimaris]
MASSSDLAVSEINQELGRLCSHLNGRSLNYTAQMQLWAAPDMAGEPIDEIIKSAVSKQSKLGGCTVSSTDELIEELTACVNYDGDAGSHPSPGFANSKQGVEIVASLVQRLRNLALGGDVYSFWLTEGHPFYPVFWDFAFLVEHGPDAYVFIGSSSD